MESQVRFTRQRRVMETVAKSHTVHNPTDNHLGLRITAFNRSHIAMTLLWCMNIRH